MSSFFWIILLIGYFILVPVLLLVCITWIIRQRQRLKQLYSSGIEVEAVIIQHSTYQAIKGRNFYVTYSFRTHPDDENAVYRREQEIGWRHYQRLKIGSHVKVRYSTNNPSLSTLSGTNRDNLTEYRMTLYAAVLGAVWLTVLLIGLGSIGFGR